MKGKTLLCLFLLLPLFGQPAFSQITAEKDLRELSLDELMGVQVITSTQQQVKLSEAPSTVYVYTGDQIRRWGIRRLAELIDRLVPGAMSMEDFDDIILAFRGVSADNNLKVLLLLNGHEYNTQWNNGPSSEVELGMISDIKRVEVLIGPHSALYGGSALIGVINIITKTGQDFSGVKITGTVGSGGYKRGELIWGKEVNEDLNYFLSAGGLAADGYTNNDNDPLNISRYQPSGRFYVNVNYHDFEIMTRYTRSARALYVLPRSDTRPNLWTNYDTILFDAGRSFRLGSNFSCRASIGFDAIQTQRHDYTLGTKLRAVGEERYSAKFTSFISGLPRNHFVLGAYFRHDEFGEDWAGNNHNFSTTIVDGQVTGIPADPYTRRVLTPYGRNVYSLFGQDSITLHKKATLLLGFRFDRTEAPQIAEPNSFSPRAALVVVPNERTVLKAMFTVGVARQINAAATGPPAISLGIPITYTIQDAEKMYSYELSGSYKVNSNLDFSLNVFYNSLRDIFGLDPAQLPAQIVLISGGRIDYVGFEAIANVDLTPDASVRFVQQHVQFASTVDDPVNLLTTPDDEHPYNYPENVTKLLVDTRLMRTVTFNANANLVWNTYAGTAANIAGGLEGQTRETGFYALVNANLLWTIRPELELMFSGYNLLNTRETVPPFTAHAELAERNFNVSLAVKF